MIDFDLWLRRTLCNVLEEMRTCGKTRNYANLDSLIEEAQSMANRMEAKLGQVRDIRDIDKAWRQAKRKSKALAKIKEKEGTDGEG